MAFSFQLLTDFCPPTVCVKQPWKNPIIIKNRNLTGSERSHFDVSCVGIECFSVILFVTTLKSVWIELSFISTWNKWAFSIHVPGLTVNNSSKEKYGHFWYLVVLRWSPNYRVSSSHEVKSSHYGSLVLALMSCSSCIIEGTGSHWETLQRLGDVNRKLIVADERRRIHRKPRLPGVLDGWVSLPHLLSHSFFFLSLFWSVIVKLRGRHTKLVLLHHMCTDVWLKGNHWMRDQK